MERKAPFLSAGRVPRAARLVVFFDFRPITNSKGILGDPKHDRLIGHFYPTIWIDHMVLFWVIVSDPS